MKDNFLLFRIRLQAYRGANDDVRAAVAHLRQNRLNGSLETPFAVIGWSNSGTILNNVLAEQVA